MNTLKDLLKTNVAQIRDSVSSAINEGPPTTFQIPMGPIRLTVQNCACMAHGTPPVTFEKLTKVAFNAENAAGALLSSLDAHHGKAATALQHLLSVTKGGAAVSVDQNAARCARYAEKLESALSSARGRWSPPT